MCLSHVDTVKVSFTAILVHLAPFTSQLSNTHLLSLSYNTLTHTKTHSVLSPITLILTVH